MSKNTEIKLVGQPILSQLLQLVDKRSFKELVKEKQSDYYYKAFKSWPQFVTMMFTNNIGELLTTVNVSSPNYAYLLNPKTIFFGANKYGLAWAIDQTGQKNIHNAGTVYWCGLGNTFYSINRKKGEAVLFFSNSFPLLNSFTEELYYNAEGAIYNVK